MKQRVFATAIVLMALGAASVFASGGDTVLDTEFNKAGQFNLNAGLGLYYGPGVDLGGEYIITKLDIPNFPMELGVAARGYVLFGIPPFGGIDWGIAPMAMLHKGFHFGANADFELYIGAGIGLGGSSTGFTNVPFGIGFATFDGLAWKLMDKFWLQVEYGGVYGMMSTSMASFGVRLEL